MILVGCDLHSRQQHVAVLDTTTGEVSVSESGRLRHGLQAPVAPRRRLNAVRVVYAPGRRP